MKNALVVFNRSIYDSYQHLSKVMLLTILWWLSVLPIFTLGPATAGLFYALKRRDESKNLRKEFFHGMKMYFLVSFKLTILSLFVTLPCIFYMYFLLTMETTFAYFLALLLLYVLIMWHLIMLYVFPLMVELNQKKVSILLKYALRLTCEHFVFSSCIGFYILLVALLSSIISIMLVVMVGCVAIICYNSLLFLLSVTLPDQYNFDHEVNWKGILRPWKP